MEYFQIKTSDFYSILFELFLFPSVQKTQGYTVNKLKVFNSFMPLVLFYTPWKSQKTEIF